jgi:hypothetical protein
MRIKTKQRQQRRDASNERVWQEQEERMKVKSYTSPKKRGRDDDKPMTIHIYERGLANQIRQYKSVEHKLRIGFKVLANHTDDVTRGGLLVLNGRDAEVAKPQLRVGYTYKCSGLKSSLCQDGSLLISKSYGAELLIEATTSNTSSQLPPVEASEVLANFLEAKPDDVCRSLFGGVLECKKILVRQNHVYAISLALAGSEEVHKINFLLGSDYAPFVVGDTVEVQHAIVSEYQNKPSIKVASMTCFFKPGPTWTDSMRTWATKFDVDSYNKTYEIDSVHDMLDNALQGYYNDEVIFKVQACFSDCRGSLVVVACGNEKCFKTIRNGDAECGSGHNDQPKMVWMCNMILADNVNGKELDKNVMMFNGPASKLFGMSACEYNDLSDDDKDKFHTKHFDVMYDLQVKISEANKKYPKMSILSAKLTTEPSK